MDDKKIEIEKQPKTQYRIFAIGLKPTELPFRTGLGKVAKRHKPQNNIISLKTPQVKQYLILKTTTNL